MAMEANDVDAAGRVQTLLNYEVKQRLRAELWRELNFAAQWTRIFGHAVMHVGWSQEWTTGRERLSEGTAGRDAGRGRPDGAASHYGAACG
jgi:hypothetical protein